MSFHLSPINQNADKNQQIHRIYIDPEQLIALKTKRTSLTMVPSIYEPPQQNLSPKNYVASTKKTDYSLVKNNSSSNLIDKKPPKILYERDSEMLLPQQKIKILKDTLEGQNIAPNVQFIWKLLPSTFSKHVINFQQGDCIPFNGINDDKYLVLSGQVRIIGLNQHQFKRKAGYLLFLSKDTYSKIKEIIALSSTKLLKIPNSIYQNLIKNFLNLKNSQKIKFIQYCPFLIWKDQLTDDLAACMEMKTTEKQEIIYHAHSNPECIYFVKEGIVLLERNTKLMNPVVQDYEQHYQKNQITEKDTILVVRKGMAFGIDGIIIKEFSSNAFSNIQLGKAFVEQQAQTHKKLTELSFNRPTEKKQNDQLNPENSLLSKNLERINRRVYTAKTLGKCELYCLDKKILQTLFSISDINEQMYIKKKEILSGELQRMSIQYTNMLLNTMHPHNIQVPIKKNDLILRVQRQKPIIKSNSLSFLKLRSYNSCEKQKDKLNLSPKAFLLKNKRISQSIHINESLKNQKYITEQRQINELRNRIKSQREKEKIQRIKKPKNNENLTSNKKNDDESAYILPKIINNLSDNQTLQQLTSNQKKIQKYNSNLDQIIQHKLKEDIKSYPSKGPQAMRKSESITIYHQNTNDSELMKLLEENQQNKKGYPSFINVKSYKSIISVYESVPKRD